MEKKYNDFYFCRVFNITFIEHLKMLNKPSLVVFVKTKDDIETTISAYPTRISNFFSTIENKYYVISNNKTGYLYINGKKEIRNKKKRN